MTRSQFRFLTDKEYNAIDSDNSESVRDAEALNTKRNQEHQKRVAENFVKRADAVASKEDLGRNDLAEWNRTLKASGNNILATLDTFLYNNPHYRAEINAHGLAKYGDKYSRKMLGYATVAAKAGKGAFEAYMAGEKAFNRALLTTADAPGAANTIQTTVSQNIIFRSENVGNVLPLLTKIEVPFGDYEQPFYNKYAMGGYLAETGTVADFNTSLSDATDGIKKTKWTPRDFALGLEQSFRSLKKLSPSILANILSLVAEGLTVGMEYQAVSGPGTGNTDAGMLLNATSITTGTDVYEKFINARSEVSSNRVRNVVAFANAKAIGEFHKLKVTNEAYRGIITKTATGLSIDNTEIIEVSETVIPTTAGSTSIVLGDPSHYMVVETGEITEYVDQTPKSLNQFTAFVTYRDGAPIYNDSFSKFTLSV